jgi:hypothetical protein
MQEQPKASRILYLDADLENDGERLAFLEAVPNRDEVLQFLAVDDEPVHMATYARFYLPQNRIAAFAASTGKRILYWAVTEISPAQSDLIARDLGSAGAWSPRAVRELAERVLGAPVAAGWL